MMIMITTLSFVTILVDNESKFELYTVAVIKVFKTPRMYNRTKKTKQSLKTIKPLSDKIKTIRNSATKTPKQLDGTHPNRSPQLHKFKSVPSKPKRQTTHSLLPSDIAFQENETESNLRTYKTNKTNTTAVDIPYSNSEKTLQFHYTDQNQKSIYRQERTGKKRKEKMSNYDLQTKNTHKEAATTRKSCSKKVILDSLVRKTDRILKKYQKREQEWQKERAELIDELQELKKRKHTGRTLTSSASSYIQKRVY